MQLIEISIHSASGQLIQRFTPKTSSDLCITHEMYKGTRSFDVSAQLTELLEQGLSENHQSYSLFCTYVKFGQPQQERVDFDVTMRRTE